MAFEQEAKNLKLVEALYAATGSGDWVTVESMLTDDFFITEADALPYAGVYRGKKALQTLFEKVMSSMSVGALDLHQLTAGGDRCVALLDLVIAGPEGTRVPIAETFRVRDGKVCEIKPYYFDPKPVCDAVARKRAQGA